MFQNNQKSGCCKEEEVKKKDANANVTDEENTKAQISE